MYWARSQRPGPDAIDIASGELDAASEGILTIVQGVPLAELGGGRLSGAIRELAKASPLTMSVTTDREAMGGPEAEHALYYVCSEALTNAMKHARASRIDIDLRSDGDDLVETIADDGVGGADASGSGLQGLADRLAARGGRLRVDSPPGAGTTLTAWVPR
jgi:signal transduction histidine kinase